MAYAGEGSGRLPCSPHSPSLSWGWGGRWEGWMGLSKCSQRRLPKDFIKESGTVLKQESCTVRVREAVSSTYSQLPEKNPFLVLN